eukprot:scaffold16582_cov75-Cyclotella_meneghiniana.AAC.5
MKSDAVSFTQDVNFGGYSRKEINISSSLTIDTTSFVDLEEDDTVMISGKENKSKRSNRSAVTEAEEEPLGGHAFHPKEKIQESSSEHHSSGKLTEDEDALSNVTWNPKQEVPKHSASQNNLLAHRRCSSGPEGKTAFHHKNHSQVSVDLIDDSNQEPHYSNLIDTANAPIFVSEHESSLGVDSEGRVNVWNKCAVRIVGYTAEEVMGKNLVKKFITKDYQASVSAVIDRALQGDETANYEFPLMTKDGVRIEILLNATARRDPNGVIIGVVGIGQDITGRIAQEREYTRLIDTANAPIFGVDTQGGKSILLSMPISCPNLITDNSLSVLAVNIWNQSAIQLVGYSTEEVMGKNLVKEFITDEFKTAVQAVLDQALHGEETANFEESIMTPNLSLSKYAQTHLTIFSLLLQFPLMTKAGVRLEVLLNATTRRDEQGTIIGVVGIGQDITGRLAQEREYARLIDTANAPIFGVDTQGRVNVWNKCAIGLIGYSTEEVMGRSLVQEFITEDFKRPVQAVLDEALAGNETGNFEFPLITKGGARIEVLLNATTRRDEQGSVIGVVGIGQDITARLAQEREYSKLIDSANAPIFGVDNMGRVNVWNQCAIRLVGYTINEVMGKNLVQEFITKEYRAAVSSVLDKALHGEETSNFEFPLLTKNGVRIEVLLNATTRKDEQGSIIGVVGIGQDITARLAQEREYSKLIDTANAPIFGVDVQGKRLCKSSNKDKMLPHHESKVSTYLFFNSRGHSLVQEFITKDFQARVQRVLDQALAGTESANFEFPLMTKAGVRLEVLLNATTRRDEQGTIIGVVGIGQDITARLAQEREYFKLIDNANAPIFGVDTQGCARKIVGYTLDEVMGHNLVEEFITKEYKEAVSSVLEKALKGEETSNFEFPLITRNGVRIEVLLNATTRKDEQGAVIGVVGIGQDITGRIAQEREYSKLIDSANAPIFGVDTEGVSRVNVWNICARKLVGYTTDEVMGHSLVEEFITKDYQASVQAVLDSALGGVESANFEFPLITKAGARIEVLLNATTRRNEHGKIIGRLDAIRFSSSDITGRIAQEREYAKLIDTANAPIFGVDTEGRVNVWNKCARKLVGYTPSEVMGKNLVQEFITDEFKTAVQAVLDQALGGEETANFEESGVRLEVLLNATTRRDEQGSVIGVVGIGQDITARLAQEREYSKLIDTANAPIFGVDTTGRVNVWNQNAHKLVGYAPEEVMGQNLVEQFITPEHRARVQSVIDEALAGEETANFEESVQLLFPLMTKTGVRLEVLLNATTRRDEQGDVIGVVGIGQDITARLAQEREYTRLIDTANAPIFGVDNHGVSSFVLCAMRLTGYPSEEVMGHSLVKEFIRKEHQEKVQEVIDQTLHGKETANFDFPLTTKGGVRLEILLNATTRRNEHGLIIGMVGIGQDITERIAQEREFAKLIDSANAPIFGVDVEGKVNVWNQCVASLTGFEAGDVFDRKLVDELVSCEFKDSVSEILKNAMMGIETSNFEFPLLTSGDHVVEVLLNATTRRDAQDNVIGVVGIGQDITDARAKRDAEMKQRAAEAATAAQATISAHVYHEIRNVVGSVLALADRATEAVDLALFDEDDEDGLRELPIRVRKLTDHQRLVCQHAVDTLNDMLDVAKMENGTYTPKHEVIDLGELCRKAAALQSPRMRPNVILDLNVPSPNTSFIISDSVLLLQYLSNLLSNAAKFTVEGGVVLVCIAREAGPDWIDVTLGVADSGPGIATESQRHVLRAFTTGDALPQEDKVGGTKSTGIGLRLADLISKTLTEPSLKPHKDGTVVKIEGGGGTLSKGSLGLIESISDAGLKIESPLGPNHDHHVSNGGPGAFIYFQSAIQRASPEAIERHRENPSGEVFQEIAFGTYLYKVEFSGTMKVLIIDDQRTMRQMVAMLYQKLAFEYPGVIIDCYTALSGEQAVRMCREHRFHIITMDQQMSVDYCQSQINEVSEGTRPDGEIPLFVRFGSDKISNAKKRQAYFKHDKWIQDIQHGDGHMLGHEAIRKIKKEIQEGNRPPGNLLEADRLMFLEVGSSGMLPKPTKFEDFMSLLTKNLGLYISQGLLQLKENKVVMDDGLLQLGRRFLRDEIENGPTTTEHTKLNVPWAGGATQRSTAPDQS